MYCGKCGKLAEEEDLFCADCGSKLIIKKKTFTRKARISGNKLAIDYSGIVFKIDVILAFLLVTGQWIFGNEIVNNSLETIGNGFNDIFNGQWGMGMTEGYLTVNYFKEFIGNMFLASMKVQINMLLHAPIYVKAWYILYDIAYAWIYITTFLAGWRLFEKAGIRGWKILIPFYNLYCISRIAYRKGWIIFAEIACWIGVCYFLALYGGVGFILVISLLLIFIFWGFVVTKYEHSLLYALGLMFFPIFFLQILGWGNESYSE